MDVESTSPEQRLTIQTSTASQNPDDQGFALLIANEERLRMAMTAAKIATFDWNIQTGEVSWSENLELFMGMGPGSFGKTIKSFREFVHPEDRDRVEQAIDRALQSGEPYEIEFRMIRVDGSERWVQSRAQVYFNDDDQPVRLIGIDIDITDHKRAEEALRRSEAEAKARAAELSTILDTVPAMTFIAHDPECLKMTSSRAAYKMLQLRPGANTSKSAPEEERPTNFRILKDGREVPMDQLPVQLAASTGREIRDYELSLVFDDGTSLDILGNAAPLLGDEGEVRGAVGAFIDITERRRAEAELQANKAELVQSYQQLRKQIEERTTELAQRRLAQDRERRLMAEIIEADTKFRAVFDQCSGFAGIMTVDGFLIDANHLSLEACGYHAEEVLDRLFWETAWWRGNTEVQAKIREATLRAADGIPYREELPYVWADGSARVVDFTLHPIRNENGKVIYLHPSGTDITDRKIAERKLSQREAQLEEAQRLASVGNWHWHRDADVVTWSKELYRIAGRDPNLPAPRYAEQRELFTPESWARLNAAVEETLRSGKPYELELEMVRPDGTTRWIITRAEAEFDLSGSVATLFGSLQDITGRKQADADLRKAHDDLEQRVKERTQELSTALANVEHVMKIREEAEEKMRALSGHMLRIQDEDRRRIARDLHDSAGQTLSALKLTIDMLSRKVQWEDATSRLFDDLKVLSSQAVDEIRTASYLLHPPLLDEVGFGSAAQWFLDGLSKRSRLQISIDIETSKRMPPEVEIVFFRVLQESVTNIYRHSGSRAVEVTFNLIAGIATLTVRDHGRGIPENILERFRHSKLGGGVGLAGMAERVGEVGGQLQIESDPSGTTLIAKIPVMMPNSRYEGPKSW
jgi:PAS domain S-box-containing protein